MKKLLIIFLILACSFPSYAATVYVDNNTTDCSTPTDTDYDPTSRACGSGSATVYDDVTSAINSRSDGDTVYIRSGSHVTSTSPNTPAANLNIIGDGKESTFVSGAYFIIDTNGNTISDFRMTGYGTNDGTASFYVTGSNNTLSNLWIHPAHIDCRGINLMGDSNTVDSSLWDYGFTQANIKTHTGSNDAATLVDSTQSWEVNSLVDRYVVNATDASSCKIIANDATSITCTLTGGTENLWDTGDWYVVADAFGSVPIRTAGAHNYITNNIFRNLGHIHAIYLAWGSDNHFESNTIYNGFYVGNLIHLDLMQTWGSGGSYTTGSYIYFDKNLVYNFDGQHFNLSNDSSSSPGYFYIRNNVFLNQGLVSNFGVPYVHLLNNTFVKGSFNTYGLRFMCSGVDGVWDSSNAVVKNNVFVGLGTPDGNDNRYGWFGFEDEGTCGGNSASNNYVSKNADYSTPYQAKTSWNTSDGNKNGGDPKFVSYALDGTGNFNLQSDSLLIGAGADLSAIWASATDKNGVSRPQGAAWDIGAYEYEEGGDPPAGGSRSTMLIHSGGMPVKIQSGGLVMSLP